MKKILATLLSASFPLSPMNVSQMSADDHRRLSRQRWRAPPVSRRQRLPPDVTGGFPCRKGLAETLSAKV
ncbi:hypothetical protein J0663_01085 [Rhizobium lentis]|uniref:hypothetical protein n=1 Tax=Rhizobium lentis TaxID=1138194 RepID=UPI001A92DF70|nr:hypothetical protein [Rhizobium lentis]MBX5064188.1 hypothetical protein [Rhizobium lentis]MBX5076294.1 hypothetical protein [Rhizobium lentis]QSW95897.1 hypothetical protein J0663_01085 [Rhizobium lentis]